MALSQVRARDQPVTERYFRRSDGGLVPLQPLQLTGAPAAANRQATADSHDQQHHLVTTSAAPATRAPRPVVLPLAPPPAPRPPPLPVPLPRGWQRSR